MISALYNPLIVSDSYKIDRNITVQLNANKLFDKDCIASINKSGYRYSPGAPRSGQLTVSMDYQSLGRMPGVPVMFASGRLRHSPSRPEAFDRASVRIAVRSRRGKSSAQLHADVFAAVWIGVRVGERQLR